MASLSDARVGPSALGARARLADCLEHLGCLVNLFRGSNARLERALDPRVVQRRVLPGKVDAPFGSDDRGLQSGLLFRLEEGERAARKRIAIPVLDCPHLELGGDLGMYLG